MPNNDWKLVHLQTAASLSEEVNGSVTCPAKTEDPGPAKTQNPGLPGSGAILLSISALAKGWACKPKTWFFAIFPD
jgi:hypothetical protein